MGLGKAEEEGPVDEGVLGKKVRFSGVLETWGDAAGTRCWRWRRQGVHAGQGMLGRLTG